MKNLRPFVALVLLLASACSTTLIPQRNAVTQTKIDTSIKEDEAIKAFYKSYKLSLDSQMNETIAYSEVEMQKGSSESILSNFFSDAIASTCKSKGINFDFAMPTTNGGIISGYELECNNYNPSIISSTSLASGGGGTITYQWEYSNDNINWTEIAGATSSTYDPSTIYQTTYYRRKSKSSLCSSFGAISNTIVKENQGFDNWQIITEGNATFTSGTHIHGPLSVGGNLIINSAGSKVEVNMDNTGTYTFPGDAASTGLLVKGGVTFTSGYMGVLSNRLIHIGNSTGLLSGDNGNNSATQVYPNATGYNNALRIEATVDQTPSPAVFQNVGYDFTQLFSYYRSGSQTLSTRSNNVQLYI